MKPISDIIEETLGACCVSFLAFSATTNFNESRPVPFALREKVEEELWKQVEDGELEPVD